LSFVGEELGREIMFYGLELKITNARANCRKIGGRFLRIMTTSINKPVTETEFGIGFDHCFI
jgi:hypothetical protein